MKKSTFSLREHKEFFLKHIKGVDKKILAKWAIDCTERVMPYFEERYPQDLRPRAAINELKVWILTGRFKMAVIRKASLDSHAAARAVGEDSPARSAARAAGQTVATAHVSTHAIGGAIYALQAIHRATGSEEEVSKERKWQYEHLIKIREL